MLVGETDCSGDDRRLFLMPWRYALIPELEGVCDPPNRRPIREVQRSLQPRPQEYLPSSFRRRFGRG